MAFLRIRGSGAQIVRTEVVLFEGDAFQSHVRVYQLKRDPEVECIVVVAEEMPQCIVHRRRSDGRWSSRMFPLPELGRRH